jgi:hypothetical protein
MSSNFPSPSSGGAQPSLDRDCSTYLKAAGYSLKKDDPGSARLFQNAAAACQAYKQDEGNYSLQGRQALQRIRPALARGLDHDMTTNPDKSPKDLGKDWMQNHGQIYKEANVCRLPLADKVRIVTSAGPILREHPEIAVQSVVGAVGSTAKAAVGGDPLSPSYRAGSAAAAAGDK